MADRVSFELDGRIMTTRAGRTIAEAASDADRPIDTLCANRRHRDCSRCMVCAVYLPEREAFAPACTEMAGEGMHVESESGRVADFRRTVVELLLSEHHGDCAAPCHRACPAGFDIPRFLEMLNVGATDDARIMISVAPPPCAACDARCERACRRKVFAGRPVGVKALIAEHTPFSLSQGERGRSDKAAQVFPVVEARRYFHTLRVPPEKRTKFIGRMEKQRDINGCWHCQCHAGDSCVLRRLAEKYGARQNRFAVLDGELDRELDGKDGTIQGRTVVFDPGKCVRCGACVELSNELGHVRAPCFTSRGADFAVRPPLTIDPGESLDEWDERFADACPTGAIMSRRGVSNE